MLESTFDGRRRFRPRSTTTTMKKKTTKKPKDDETPAVSAPQIAGRLGAERWLAVRQKSGAGPIEPKERKLTRAERARQALDLESDGRDV
jgi:hypothetical protein